MTTIRTMLAAAVVLLSAACASSGTSAPATSAPRRDRNLITEEEVAATKANDAYSVVRVARPAWLLPKTVGGRQMSVQVYVEGNKAGGVSALQQYQVATIRELRYLSPEDATTRFGTGNAGGAILISLKR